MHFLVAFISITDGTSFILRANGNKIKSSTLRLIHLFHKPLRAFILGM